MPTPVSVADSPSMAERSDKMLSTYDHQGEASQQLTPPTTARPWPYTPSMTSVSSASMTVPTSAADAEMIDIQALEASHSPEQQVVESSQHFHWGTYGVSSHDPAEEMNPPLPSQALYSAVSPSLLIRSPNYGMPHHPHVPMPSALSQVPMPLHPADARPLLAHTYEHCQDFDKIEVRFGPTYPRKSRSRANRNGRQAKRSRPVPQNGDLGYHDPNVDPMLQSIAPGHPAHVGPRHLTLDDKAPEDSKFLVDLRCQLSDDKGKGMWESIQQAYKERFGRKTKENLQMQLIRTIQSYAIWSQPEDQALREANEEYERRRYQEIRKIMKEKGGRQLWDWNEGNIAKRLVEMDIDEIDEKDPVKRTRRKRKSTVRRKSGGEPWVGCVNIQYNSQPRELSTHEDQMLLEAFCKTEPDSPHPEALTSSTGGNRDPSDKQSARVAKQACDQMLSRQGENLYPGSSPYMA
ncbi:hypothetical protein F4808DRAFT_436588 [Astrocystis sublimbata]|nr:hypothetical protein F4808DRAFT_436588 [Astrocystis sublimbata]